MAEYPLAEILTLEGGRTVEWEAVGAGPPLMWVEGGPGLWAHLARPDVALVSDLFCCHLVNAPGCGRTSGPADVTGYDLTRIIAFFEEVRGRLGLGQVTVMGHSWRGLVAAAWAAAHPEPVGRLVICGPAWNRPIAAAIPAARYLEIADSGHIPQYEQPDAFRDALLGWLAAT